jgi:rod shape determining protein RodA
MGQQFDSIDWITAFLLSAIGLFGLFVLLTISPTLFSQQFVFLIVGMVLYVVFSRVDYALLWWFAPIGYVLSLIALATSYLGPVIRGSTRWIMIGTAQLQPSELVKPFMLLAFCWFMTRFPPREIKYVGLHVILFLIPFLLVFKQPDLGTSLVYLGLWTAMLVAGGFPVLLLVAGIAFGIFLLPFFWQHLHDYQRDRVLTFLNPLIDPRGAGYNALQAMIAVGSGQLFGRGLGRGTQSHLRFLPEFHTDFIFATLIEELGFGGGILLFLLYFALLWRIVRQFFVSSLENVPYFIYSFGLFSMLLVQIFINTGMNMGIIPITGITLPFVSYGGSSILSIAVSFGILHALRQPHGQDRNIAFTSK